MVHINIGVSQILYMYITSLINSVFNSDEHENQGTQKKIINMKAYKQSEENRDNYQHR